MFQEIDFNSVQFNIFQDIQKQWMLIAAGDEKKYNMMTASWGGFGTLWNQSVAYIFVRPQRYTKQLIDQTSMFSISFFSKDNQHILKDMGTYSGNHMDKMKYDKLHPVKSSPIYFKEANLVMLCKTLYTHCMDYNHFQNSKILNHYKDYDMHTLYIAQVTSILRKQDS